MTVEQICENYKKQVDALNKAKEAFNKALCEYEDAIDNIENEMRNITWDAKNCADMPIHKTIAIAKREAELNLLTKRFNGLKCELV